MHIFPLIDTCITIQIIKPNLQTQLSDLHRTVLPKHWSYSYHQATVLNLKRSLLQMTALHPQQYPISFFFFAVVF